MSRFNSKEDLEHNILVLDEYPLADPRKSIAAFPDALSDDQPDSDSTYTAADTTADSYFDPNYDSRSLLTRSARAPVHSLVYTHQSRSIKVRNNFQ